MERKLLVAFHLFLILGGVRAATLTVTNNCPYTIWPAISTNPLSPLIPNNASSFELPSKASNTINVLPGWGGHIWARTHCANVDNGTFICGTGGCNTPSMECDGSLPSPPVTYTELHIAPSAGLQDTYQVAVAAGFNVPVSVGPLGASCGAAACPVDINAVCPPELRVVGDGGETIGCMGACQALGDPADCCTGQYAGRANCKPTSYNEFFKSQCPESMAYAYDGSALHKCSTGFNYLVTYCP